MPLSEKRIIEPKVGMKIKDWVIARVWDWPKYWDLNLLKEGQDIGYLRVMKNKGVIYD